MGIYLDFHVVVVGLGGPHAVRMDLADDPVMKVRGCFIVKLLGNGG